MPECSTQPNQHSADWKRPRYLGLVFALVLTSAVYAPAVFAYFQRDDFGLLLRTAEGKSPLNCIGWFCRPMFLVVFKGAYGLFGLHAWLWHVAAICLHLANVALLYSFMRRMRLSPAAATVGAALFGVFFSHPEAVTWLCACSGVMAAFFGLVAAHIAISTRIPPVARGLLCACVWMLGLFSKEEVAGFAAALPFLPLLVEGKKNKTELAKWFGSCLAFAAGILVFQRLELACQQQLGNPRAHIDAISLRLATSFTLQAMRVPMTLLSVSTLWGVMLLAVVPVLVWFRRPDLRLGLLFFFGPAFVIGLCAGSLGAPDRYLYIPSIGLAILLAQLMEGLRKREVGPVFTGWLMLGMFIIVLAQTPWAAVSWAVIAVLAVWFWIDSAPSGSDQRITLGLLGCAILLEAISLFLYYTGLGWVPYWVWLIAPIVLIGLLILVRRGTFPAATTTVCACFLFWPDLRYDVHFLMAMGAIELFRSWFASPVKLSAAVVERVHSLRRHRVPVLAGIAIATSAACSFSTNLDWLADGLRVQKMAAREAALIRTLPQGANVRIADEALIGGPETRVHNVIASLMAKRPDIRVEVLPRHSLEFRPTPKRPWIECQPDQYPVLHNSENEPHSADVGMPEGRSAAPR